MFIYRWHYCVKSVQIWSFSGSYFRAFGLYAERNGVRRRDFQPECGKIRTRKNSVFGHFSRCALVNVVSIYHMVFYIFHLTVRDQIWRGIHLCQTFQNINILIFSTKVLQKEFERRRVSFWYDHSDQFL